MNMHIEPASQQKLPITILTGFLGSGKTTLLNYILTERHGHRIAVIENEYGEVDVDSDLVLASDEEIFQMQNGCICCFVDVRNDLIDVMKKLLSHKDKFDHIIVETSGLADPTPVATAFFVDRSVADEVELDAVVTLVDAMHIDQHLYDPVLDGSDNQAVNQIVAADRILVNKIDLAGEDALGSLETSLRRLNQTAPILRSSYGKVDLSNILGVKGFRPSYVRERAEILDIDMDDDRDAEHHHHHDCKEPCCDHAHHDHGHHHHHDHGRAHATPLRPHQHDATVKSHSFVYPEAFDGEKLAGFLKGYLGEHGDDIFRTKGIVSVAGDDRFFVLQAVHKLVDFRPDHAWGEDKRKSKFVFIGRNLDRESIDRNLRACLVP
ncbi:GTP-binding protein [Ensifer sp. ENS03]|jgi:G3E family GTPase|uniref:CobW family GTP-binding protein n=2 Tax=Sinorhizobium/Ensifer group TaxID=227292 RepID=UPI000723DA69|nr:MULTISPECIES: GTP-binding protein [Ensifer]KSV72351.1 cobalamin biosynthesis protein [Sinorhizobium sp. GW3]MBD9524190.1 GTP-binding protein [Ensifer sp. ENS02]MBD9560293.1 GTP-binding protein [Ensifer sp. ENS03]MBD9626508.1 GTP-binding protein [Ensifer sp. ENS06]MCY1745464.1 GTP-binding protein [Ensifer sp. SL37]